MSLPEPMPCLLDACRSPLACQSYGGCKARRDDAYRSWEEAVRECRERGLRPWEEHK